MKKVLIITYYWFPSGGAGVQRWLKFTKYLRNFGWEPIIYTPENPEYPSNDYSLEKDIPTNLTVIKRRIWEPYNIYRYLFGKKNTKINAGFISENGKFGLKDKISAWIRGNFLIPDARCFWVKPSVKFLTDYLKQNPVNAIITTGPPHSMHLIGLGVKKKMPNLLWISDFRDPWTDIDFNKDLHLSWLASKIHHRLEKKVVQTTDCFITVSPTWMKSFLHLHPKRKQVITNGYDEEDVDLTNVQLDEKFTISHIGTLNFDRNPPALWQALGELCAENTEFGNDLEVRLIGKIDFSVLESVKQNQLEDKLNKISYLTHKEAIQQQQSSQVLLLLINRSDNAKGILTGKFYEYLASHRPILTIGQLDGDIAAVLQETNAGKIADFDDVAAMKDILLNYYEQYKTHTLSVQSKSIEQFSRKNLTSQLAELLNELSSKNQ